MRNSLKLRIDDNGDSSVGIFPVTWEVECPFCKENIDNGDIDKETLEWFRQQQIDTYKEFAEGRIYATYEHELDND